MPDLSARRPLKSRGVKVFQKLAAWLSHRGCSPDAISFLSIVFGVGAGMALAATDCLEGSPVRLCWLVAAILIQGRLLANLLDGMVAVEGGKAGPVGALWNEVPDRIADIAILIGAGFAAGSLPLLGFAAALSAVFVAYIRALGGNLGAGEIFLGPQSKPQRMALLTGCAFISAAFPNYETSIGIEPSPLIMVTLALMIVGCLITACRRLARISQHLRSKAV